MLQTCLDLIRKLLVLTVPFETGSTLIKPTTTSTTTQDDNGIYSIRLLFKYIILPSKITICLIML